MSLLAHKGAVQGVLGDGGAVAGPWQGLVSAGSSPGHEVFQSIVLVVVV